MQRAQGPAWVWGALPALRAPDLAHQHSPEMQEIFSLRLTLLAKYNPSSFFRAKNMSIKTVPAATAGGGRGNAPGRRRRGASVPAVPRRAT